MTAMDLDDAYYAMLNELLVGCTPAQAYTVGEVTVMALQDNLMPDRQLLYAAATVPRIGLAITLYRAWKGSRPL